MHRFFNVDTNDDDGWRRKIEHRRQKTRPLVGAGFEIICSLGEKNNITELEVLVNELALDHGLDRLIRSRPATALLTMASS